MVKPSDFEYTDYDRGYSDGWRDAVLDCERRLNTTDDEKTQEIRRLRIELAATKGEMMKMTSPTEAGRQGGML